jgi:hypothetical protein
MEHLAKHRSLASRGGQPFSVPGNFEGYDRLLVSEGIMDRPFDSSVGSSAVVRLVNVSRCSASSPVDGRSGVYDLSGNGRNALAGAKYVVEAVVRDVLEADARALNDASDGPRLGAAAGSGDFQGRVTYAAASPGQRCEVHIYIAHQ